MDIISNLSDEELANLSEDKLESLLKLECASKGIPYLEEPVAPTLEPLPTIKPFKAYRIGDISDCLFLEKAELDQVLDCMSKCKSIHYKLGTVMDREIKGSCYIEDKPMSSKSIESIYISESDCINYSEYKVAEAIVRRNDEEGDKYYYLASQWREKMKPFFEYGFQVWDRYHNAKKEKEEKEHKLYLFKINYDILNQNFEQAMAIFKRYHKVDAQLESYIKENI